MSKYDRVSYPDKAHFSTPSDAHDYTDDVFNHNETSRTSNGNGIYNDYTVELHPKQYKERFNVLCLKFPNTNKCKFMLVASILVVCLVLVLIIVAAASHKGSGNGSSTAITEQIGLVAYGPDNNGRIIFNPSDHESYMPYFYRLEHYLSTYSLLDQMANKDTFIKCDSNFTSVPEGKVCMQTVTEFGKNCHHYQMYDIREGRPCVLLVLKLKEGDMPKPFNLSGTQNVDVHQILSDRYDSESVGISCDGKTDADKKQIGSDKHFGPKFDYNPPEGFPLYYFLQKPRTSDYINPAVMVQFNTLMPRHDITIRCTAWAKSFNNGQPQSSEIYSTEFTIKIE